MIDRLTLAVPMRVFAIHQASSQGVVGAEVNFELLPYFDSVHQQDFNADVPYLAESISHRPFADANQLLKPGVHLNWDFPAFLKRTQFQSSDATQLPAVPTRWLVSRYRKGKRKPDKQWVVESDALSTTTGDNRFPDLAQTSVEVDIQSGEKPFAYMGHTSLVEQWKERKGALASNFVSWKKKHSQRPLTASGWGIPSFDVFYPNSHSVFGHHDPDGTPDDRYKVTGWYGDHSDDYWLAYLKMQINGWGFEEIDAVSHLSAAEKHKRKRDRFAKLILQDLGISISLDAKIRSEELVNPDSWDRMVCCGQSTWLEDTLEVPDALYAMGNTPTEGLSALIAEKVVGERNSVSRDKLEDRLSAILMGDRLKSRKLDIGPKFREFRHADEFVGSDGGVRWIIENIDENPNKVPSGNKDQKQGKSPQLPGHLLPLLSKLNRVQKKYDMKSNELESWRFQLYSDWYRYMHASYPPAGETEEYVEATDVLVSIENGSLKEVKKLEWSLGTFGDKDRPSTGFAADVDDARQDLQTALDRVNVELKADTTIVPNYHWEVQRRAAARYWEPAPPALVVAIPHQRPPGNKPAQDNPAEQPLQPVLDCSAVSEGFTLGNDSFYCPEHLLEHDDIVWFLPKNLRSTDLPIFRGEWNAELFPVATMHPKTRHTGSYDSRYILSNYVLAENEPDLDDHPRISNIGALVKAGALYTGTTYVDQKLDDRFRNLLRQFAPLQNSQREVLKQDLKTISAKKPLDPGIAKKLKAKAARIKHEIAKLNEFESTLKQASAFLDTHDLLVVTLDGFNAALLQRHTGIQLNPADPLGFEEYQAFASEVSQALHGNYKGMSPDPHSPFLPIRSGGLRLMNLRLIDIFGRFRDLVPNDVVTPISMTLSGHDDWMRLPPRLSQAARWDFRFYQADASERTESQSHLEGSPIHGWIVPNLLDHALDFFDATGLKLGSFAIRDEESVWTPYGEDRLTGRMKHIVQWLLDAEKQFPGPTASASASSSSDTNTAPKKRFFLEEFLEDIEEAMDNIHPDDREGTSALSAIMGRPMAVVQLGVQLELKGLPAVNNSWSDLFNDLRGNGRTTDGFDQVQFCYRMGEYRQRNDGLIGFWKSKVDESLSEEFCVNDSITAAIIPEGIRKLDASYQRNAINDSQAAKDPRQWLDVKNEEWKLYDPQERTLFEFLRDEQGTPIKKQDIVQPYLREGSRVWDALVDRKCLKEEVAVQRIHHYAEASKLSISVSDPLQEYVALLDPFGVVHLSSGIQPVKAIQLPDQFFRDAIQRIELSFLTAPVLTPEQDLHLSVPRYKQFSWVWNENNTWPSDDAPGSNITSESAPHSEFKTEIPEDKMKSFQTAAFFPDRNVLREGYLTLKHNTESNEDNVQPNESEKPKENN